MNDELAPQERYDDTYFDASSIGAETNRFSLHPYWLPAETQLMARTFDVIEGILAKPTLEVTEGGAR